MRLVPRVLILPLLVCACADSVLDESGAADTAEAGEDGKFDSTGELRVRIDGMTLWVDTFARVEGEGDERVYVIDGRASRNLASVHSWVPDDAFGQAEVVSARSFEVRLTSGHEQNTLLSGMPIFVDLTSTTGEPAHAAIWLSPRATRFAGSYKLYVHTAIEPVWSGGELSYRGQVTVPAGWQTSATVAGSSAPAVFSLDARHAGIDYTFDQVSRAMVGTPITITAGDGDEVVQKAVGLSPRAVRIGLTRRDPREVWPPAQADGPSGETMAGDLRDWLIVHYQNHGADIVASGGNDLAAAQAAVDPAAFEELADPEEDPHGHDFADVRVYRHPDVIFPGSDLVWFVVYERSSGTFLEAYDFN